MDGDPRLLAISSRAEGDSVPVPDPLCPFWRTGPGVFMAADVYGKAVPSHRTEVRSRWTETSLYFLFLCPYEQLYLKPAPVLGARTDKLWNWDVAEVFIGSLRDPIHKYKEFEMSPQEEWLDFNVDLSQRDKIAVDQWRSGFQVAARIEPDEKNWYGAMRIPYAAIEDADPLPGKVLRVNFFRSQGPDHVEVAWQPPMQASFHAPEQFGTLHLV